jgi:hypothetical protein
VAAPVAGASRSASMAMPPRRIAVLRTGCSLRQEASAVNAK